MFWIVKALVSKIPDGGSIINMSSVASSIKGAPNRFVLTFERYYYAIWPPFSCRKKYRLHNKSSDWLTLSRFAYGTSKAAVIGLTKSLAADLVPRRVRVRGEIFPPYISSTVCRFVVTQSAPGLWRRPPGTTESMRARTPTLPRRSS